MGQTTIQGRIIYYFDLETNRLEPVTWANAYMKAARDALLLDRSRGGYAEHAVVLDEPTAFLWKTGQAFEATVTFEVLARHMGGV